MEGNPVLAEIYGTLSAITASGNFHPVARTPAPQTDPTLAKSPTVRGIRMFVLSSEPIASCPTDPDPTMISAGIEEDVRVFCTPNPLNCRLDMVEPFSSTSAATSTSLS